MKKRGKKMARRDVGIVARIVMVIVLTATFVGVLRWSLSVTQANARQISQNLSQVQNRMEADLAQSHDRDQPGAKVKFAPSIDPMAPRSR
jgi:type II secretory pathway pseudopilin PulG